MKQLMLSKDREAYSIGMQPSMSWAGHLLECSFPFGQEFERRPSGEPARYGSGFHELLADRIVIAIRAESGVKTLRHLSTAVVARRWDVADKEDELKEHVVAGYSTLAAWLKKNEFRINFNDVRKKGGTLFIEKAVALKPLESAREIEGHDEDHRYHGLELGEHPGTLDLAIAPVRRMRRKIPLLVLDHKTGEEDFSRPLDKAQLLSLGAAMMRITDSEQAIVGVLHARRRGMPKVYADIVKLSELKQYEGRIQTALGRIGDGSMRPGPWCTRCPAQTICPARDAELLNTAGDVLTGLTAAGGALSKEGLTANDVVVAKAPSTGLSRDKKLGILYEISRKAEALAARVRDEIKNEIIGSNGTVLPETPSGEYLIVRKYEKEGISKKSIIDAYGKLGGERRLKQLRADGAITKTTVEQLWPEKERGR